MVVAERPVTIDGGGQDVEGGLATARKGRWKVNEYVLAVNQR